LAISLSASLELAVLAVAAGAAEPPHRDPPDNPPAVRTELKPLPCRDAEPGECDNDEETDREIDPD